MFYSETRVDAVDRSIGQLNRIRSGTVPRLALVTQTRLYG